ncbi:MAG: PQQ-like beta-propeller repeat protein [Thermoguttaceae bacterium]|nr:PQQ-like beta-propeller repeat protein [Thermoguttaceae bacterium]MDW8038087.1 PQQ-binding-like beta-propeller repeat protein [Thermoguttaceae bacterium]
MKPLFFYGSCLMFLLCGACGKEGKPALQLQNSPPSVQQMETHQAKADLLSQDPLGETLSAHAPKSTAPAKGPYWPRFHGNDGHNRSSETGLLRQWPEGGPKLVWSAKGIGRGYASVSLAEGLIFTAGNIKGQTVVTALDLEGNIRWQQDNGPAWTGDYPGTRGTPTYDNGRLYHESPLGELVCLQAATGKPIWRRNILKDFDGENIRWALAESVLIDGDRLICCPGGRKAAVVALNKNTGQLVWASPSAGPASYASPSLAVHQGIRMILTMNEEGLLAVDADTGKILFDYPHKTAWDVNAFTPFYHEGHIFFSTGYGAGAVLLKVIAEGKQLRVEKVWESKELDNHHGGVVLVDGFLYGSAYGGPFVCLDWKTGKVRWKDRAVRKGSLTYADGMLYCLSEQRQVALVRPNPEKLQLVSEFVLPSGGEGPSWAHPVVCGGRLYLRHDDTLFAYDVSAK